MRKEKVDKKINEKWKDDAKKMETKRTENDNL